MKKIILAIVILIVPSFGLAATLKTGNSVDVNEGDKNIYAFSQNVNINNNLLGDAVVFSQSINSDKNVENDFFPFGNSVNISGSVGKSLRGAGNEVTISSKIGEDVLVAASSLTFTKDAAIGGDLWAAAGNATIEGTVDGNAKIAGGQITIKGKINGDLDVRASQLTVEDSADIGGSLTYWSVNEGTISSSAKIGSGPHYNKVQPQNYASRASNITYALLSLLIFALVIVYALRGFVEKVRETDLAGFAKNFGWGLLLSIAMPIVGFLLFVVSLHLGLAVLSGYALILILAYGASAIYTGTLIQMLFSKDRKFEIDWITVLIGGFVFVLVGYVPVIGPAIRFIIFIASFGYLANRSYGLMTGQSSKK